MSRRSSRREESVIKANPRCPRDKEINILLLGQTGVGKSTFINAFANYIVNDTLAEAVQDEMQVVIPSSFSHTDQETFKEKMIVIGREDEHEKFSNEGQSNTQQCRSFVFPIGQRNLRFIDTPGIGDTRGLEQDTKNFHEILTYIAQYEHLNGVFIMLKPNEERLNILFRFSVNELLRHLHVDARENIIFVFTNARSTFFMPGSTKRILEALLEKHRRDHNVDVPFSRDNTFLFDSEPFRYLALRKNGVELDNDQTLSYVKSWDHSVNEYGRLMKHISGCTLHAVSNTLSLNEAEQLIRKLPRPIAETARLIEENIQLAKDYKKKVLDNPEIASQGIPQNDAVVAPLRHPRTVCCGEHCCRVIEVDDEMKMEYLHICHEECYLRGVQQETLCDDKLQECTVMDPYSGKKFILFLLR
jgi:GTP-binding protein EngB required for normal cell division